MLMRSVESVGALGQCVVFQTRTCIRFSIRFRVEFMKICFLVFKYLMYSCGKNGRLEQNLLHPKIIFNFFPFNDTQHTFLH
jgi:hypothetical protein